MKVRKYKKKLRKDMFNKVESIHPNKNDVILLTYPIYQVPQRELYSMFKFVCRSFKNNKVLALPDTTTLTTCRKEDLESMIKQIKEVIDDL